jgi:NhaP-type Na+/H+ or K+/H+ antiporter
MKLLQVADAMTPVDRLCVGALLCRVIMPPWRSTAAHRLSRFAVMPSADDGAGSRATVTVATREESAVVAALLTSLAVLASLLIGRWAPRQYLSGCGVAALLGLALGFAALVSSWLHHGWLPLRLAFDSASFFTYLLPPIIFDAGMRVNIRQFVAKSRLPYILILGLAGTVASCAVVSALASLIHPAGMSLRSQLALGAVFAATDTVATLSVLSATAAPRLHAIVLGEGCTNDAISLVLLRAVESMPADGGNLSWQLLALVVAFSWLLLASTAVRPRAAADSNSDD